MYRKGFSLALTLWIVAIISLVSALYLEYGKKVVQKTVQLDKKLKVILEAESTIELIKFYTMTGAITLNRVQNGLLKKEFPSLPSTLFIDGRETVWKRSIIKLQDTGGMVGINDIETIANILDSDENSSKDKKDIIQDSMEDWLDQNRQTLLNGAESIFYRENGFEPRDENYFSAIEELFLVRELDNLSLIQKNKLKSTLVVSNYVTHNIYTMDLNLLGKVYNLSKVEIEQLDKAKKEGKELLLNLFYEFRPEAFNREGTGVTPTRVIQLVVTTSNKGAREQIKLLISFRANSLNAFEVLEYNN